HRRTAASFKFKIAAQESGQRRMTTAVRGCEQRHWTANTCLRCSSMGESLIVCVKSDREQRILEIVANSGGKSDQHTRILETVSDSGAKSDPKPQTPETVSDFGAKSDSKLQTPETVSDSGTKSDPKSRTPETVSNSSTK